MQRVRWSNAEKELVFNSLVRELVSNPSLSDEAALRNAQLELPAARRSKINYPKLKTSAPLIEGARKRAKEMIKPWPTPTPPPEEPPIPLETVIGKTLVALVERICEMMVERIQITVTPAQSASSPPLVEVDWAAAKANVRERANPAGATETRDAQRVLVIGLVGRQVDFIQAKYKQSPISLRFLTADEAKSQQLESQIPIVLMTKFISHSVQTKAQHATQQLYYCNGGVTECSTVIDRILQGAK
jgi:hypothetical protein